MIFFILALLAGGIANGVFAFENFDRDFDVCSLRFSNSNGDEFCDSLERVSGAEFACLVSKNIVAMYNVSIVMLIN